MQRYLIAALVATIATVIPGVIRADSNMPTQRSNPVMTGAGGCGSGHVGGACGDGSVGRITADDIKFQNLKSSVAAKVARGELPHDGNAARKLVGLPPLDPSKGGILSRQTAGGRVGIRGISGNWYWASMNKWVEPDGASYSSCSGNNNIKNPRNSAWDVHYYANMCGPGASEALISNWTNTPTTYAGYYYFGALAQNAQHWAAYQFHLSDTEMTNGDHTTSNGALRDTINSALGNLWYSVDYCAASVTTNCSSANYAQFNSDLNTDIASYFVPLINDMFTCAPDGSNCAAGWPYRAEHFQAISQFDPADGQIKYGETGSAADTCGSGYPNRAAPGAWGGTWHDPVYNYNFSDASGWDYASERYAWSRSNGLIY